MVRRRGWLIGLALGSIMLALTADAGGALHSGGAPTVRALPWTNQTVRHLATLRQPGDVLIFEDAATPDDRDLILGIQPRDFPTTTRPSFIALYDIATDRVTPLAALQAPTSQIIAATADDRWIAWSEADDANDYDWQIFAYDRQTGHITQIAQAAHDTAGQPIAGPAPAPCLAAGMLFWGQAVGPLAPPDLHNAVVRAANLVTGARTTLATSAGSPACGMPWVAWQQSAHGTTTITLDNRQMGQQRALPIAASSLALAGTSLAYISADLRAIHLIPDLAAPTRDTTIFTGANLQFVALSPRFVAWDAQGPAQVWDRAAGRVVTLPRSPADITSASWAGGHILIWYDADPANPAGSIINIAHE
jgi:hypothetical protein